MNSFGSALRLCIWGESHGVAIGGVLDGLPPGMPVDLLAIQRDLDQRRPGGPLASSRKEADRLEILSGVRDGHATGTPLSFLLRNEDARPQDYADGVLRPGHGDWPAWAASNGWADLRGGGHGSGRLTAVLVAAGSIVRPILDRHGLSIAATLQSVGEIEAPAFEGPAAEMERRVAASALRSAHPASDAAFQERIERARRDRDSIGGSIAFLADGVPPGLGEPFFGSLESALAGLLFGVPAVVGVSFGAGFAATRMAGSDLNDPYGLREGRVTPLGNKAGGLLGGRSTGSPIRGLVAIKPASSIAQPQTSVNLETSREEVVTVTGRHDPCVALRAVPVVASTLRFVLADALLAAQARGLLAAPSWPPRGPKPV